LITRAEFVESRAVYILVGNLLLELDRVILKGLI
jgi:hypothetical protein